MNLGESESEWYVKLFGNEYILLFGDPEVLLEKSDAEVDFLVRVLDLPPGCRILDLGCGFGRHSIALARRGFSVTGFDRSERLLEMARAAASQLGCAIEWQLGDMRDLGALGQYDACVCLATAFGYFTERENAAVLANVHAHLNASGILVLDVFNPLGLLTHGSATYARATVHGLVNETRAYQPLTGRVLTHRVLNHHDGRQTHFPDSDVRMYAPHEINSLLVASGFAIEGVYGSLTGDEFNWNQSGVQVWCARRATLP